MKFLSIAILTGLSFNAWAAVPPVQQETFAPDQELKVTTTFKAQVVPGPTADTKQRHIASEENNSQTWRQRQQELIGEEIQYWKYQNETATQR
jgi:hypothetical protein